MADAHAAAKGPVPKEPIPMSTLFRNAFCRALLLLGVLCGACIPSRTPPPLEILRSGALEAQGGPGVSRTVYVDARDARGPAPTLRDALLRRLTDAGFESVDNPSKAGHILHVTLVAAGPCDARAAREAVRAGFDSAVHLQGEDSAVLMADALLVERTVPSPHRARSNAMRSISRRNALADSRLRLGILLPRGGNATLSDARLAERLSRELCLPLETAAGPARETPEKARP